MVLERLLALYPIAAIVAITGALNMRMHHNVAYEDLETIVASKIDGLISYTEVECNTNGSVHVNRYYIFGGSKFYWDANGDGLVDTIYIFPHVRMGGDYYKKFEREKHLSSKPELFEEVDREFKGQLERFKPLLNR